MKAKPKASPKSAAKKLVTKIAKKASKKASKAVKAATKVVTSVATPTKKKTGASKKKKTAQTGIVAAIKRAEAKVAAVAEAIVEVAQEEFAKAERGVKKISTKKKS